MTIASEITRIKGNIAAAYTALSDKGATMPATQNSANLAATAASIPAGGGDTVTAVNYTGAAIASGDKVWLNKKANVSASSVAVTNSSSVTVTMEPTGNFVYYSEGRYYYKYNTSANTATTIENGVTSAQFGKYPYYYDEHNNLYVYQQRINDGVFNIGMLFNQDDYAIEYKTSSDYSYNLYKIDKNNGFSIAKTWTVSSQAGSTASYNRLYAIIGNKLYASTDGYNGQIGTIDDENSTITMSSRTDSLKAYAIIHSTSDNKIAIAVKKDSNGSYYKGWASVKLISVNADCTLGSEFVSSNSDLNNLLAQTPICFTFNRVTGVLCISRYDANSPYGIFKYENGDFTTIAVTLTNTSGQNWQYYYVMFVSTDLSKIQFGNILFNLEQTADGTYKAIPYTYAMGSQTLTGVANEAAANGANFEATTIVAE
ncbi:MAG: hypothetical protein IJ532_03645 [Alphaproteobacteria bacterium]|nr:hypothetical protein [Alphaproteobacteria bacterium]